MKITNHAKIRSQQRGIPTSLIDLIISHGTPKKVVGNAVAYEVSGRVKNRIIARLKYLIRLIKKLPGKVIIESEDGEVLTAYHK
jgi:hypothetical protein